jgi:hypothetical protein
MITNDATFDDGIVVVVRRSADVEEMNAPSLITIDVRVSNTLVRVVDDAVAAAANSNSNSTHGGVAI